jgi:rSAM/selenodomain-associated transferase 2
LKLSIIIPVLNEQACIAATLDHLVPLRARGVEIVVVDGGSDDDTPDIAATNSDCVVAATRGRASQQNAGAQLASGEVLLFLHGDTRLPADADALIARALADDRRVWGRFDVSFDASSPMMRVIATMMNWRSRWTSVATGDQCIFVRGSAFEAVGGFPAIALMEDVALSKLLRKVSAPVCLHARVTTSARRWQKRGVWRTIFLMSWLRLAYVLGISPDRLARWYRYH